MSFIAKNPLIIPEVDYSPSVPKAGMRGLFAGKDGWYIIDSSGNVKRIATADEIKNSGGGGSIDTDDFVTKEEISELIEIVNLLYEKSLVKTVTIDLPASSWVEDGVNKYSQVVTIEGVTPYSKVDLQPTAEQLTIFHEKDITFVTENEDGVVTVCCIGQKPVLDYSMQATITEVEIDA